MTGYGQGVGESSDARFVVELKSVNHRFCDVQVRLPREYMALEPRIAAQVRKTYHRGRVEVFIKRIDLVPAEAEVQINDALASAYFQKLQQLKSKLELQAPISLETLLGIGGVVNTLEATRDAESDWPLIASALKAALAAVQGMRIQEGAVLHRDLHERWHTLESIHQELVSLADGAEEAIRDRLLQRTRDVLARADAGDLDEGRFFQEVVYWVDRSDISEELTRFASHLSQLEGLLEDGEPVGRKIDFLLQELLREANTLGSKSNTTEQTRCAMAVKVELEKIREQVQNIE